VKVLDRVRIAIRQDAEPQRAIREQPHLHLDADALDAFPRDHENAAGRVGDVEHALLRGVRVVRGKRVPGGEHDAVRELGTVASAPNADGLYVLRQPFDARGGVRHHEPVSMNLIGLPVGKHHVVAQRDVHIDRASIANDHHGVVRAHENDDAAWQHELPSAVGQIRDRRSLRQGHERVVVRPFKTLDVAFRVHGLVLQVRLRLRLQLLRGGEHRFEHQADAFELLGDLHQLVVRFRGTHELHVGLVRVQGMLAMKQSAQRIGFRHDQTPAATLSTRTHSWTSPMSMS